LGIRPLHGPQGFTSHLDSLRVFNPEETEGFTSHLEALPRVERHAQRGRAARGQRHRLQDGHVLE